VLSAALPGALSARLHEVAADGERLFDRRTWSKNWRCRPLVLPQYGRARSSPNTGHDARSTWASTDCSTSSMRRIARCCLDFAICQALTPDAVTSRRVRLIEERIEDSINRAVMAIFGP
jgi:hypothetical protein